MKEYKQKEVVKKKKVLVAVNCDTCKEQIEVQKGYYSVTTSHHLWGNDSIDSVEHHDFCSMECMVPHLKRYYDNPEVSEEYEISFTDN